jgi:hypothetical protein
LCFATHPLVLKSANRNLEHLGNSSSTPIDLEQEENLNQQLDHIQAMHGGHTRRAETLIRASMRSSREGGHLAITDSQANREEGAPFPQTVVKLEVNDTLVTASPDTPAPSSHHLAHPDRDTRVSPQPWGTPPSDPWPATHDDDVEVISSPPSRPPPIAALSVQERIAATSELEKKNWPERIGGVLKVSALEKWWSPVRPGSLAHRVKLEEFDDDWDLSIIAYDVPSMGECILNALIHFHEQRSLPEHLQTGFHNLSPHVVEAKIRGFQSFLMSMRVYRVSVHFISIAFHLD